MNFNCSATNRLATTVQWKDKQHWSVKLFFLVGTRWSAILSSLQRDSSACGTSPLDFISFYITSQTPEWRLSPFFGAYMAPRLSDESLAEDFTLFRRSVEWTP